MNCSTRLASHRDGSTALANRRVLRRFKPFGSQTCKDVYRDSNGDLWICSDCGKAKNHNPNKCQRLNTNNGLWCS